MPAKVSKVVVITVALLLAAMLIGGWQFYQRRANAPRELVLSGALEARTVMVGSLYGGRVSHVAVDEGSQVIAGEALVMLETETIERQLREQTAAIKASQAQLARVLAGNRREEIEEARIVAENDLREKNRYAKLFRDGIVSKEAFDGRATQAGTSSARLRLLEKGSRPEDVAGAKAEVEQQEARYDSLMKQRGETSIVSSVAGVVQSLKIRPGDLVGPAQGIAEILESDQLWVRVYVPETMLGSVHVNMPASVFIDSAPGHAYKGRVAQVSSQGEYTPRNIQTREQRAEQVFGVKIVVDPDPALKAGMAATVDLGVKVPAS